MPGDVVFEVRAADLIAAYQLLSEANYLFAALEATPGDVGLQRSAHAFASAATARLLAMQRGPARVIA